MRKLLSIAAVAALAATLLVMSAPPALAVERGCNGPDVIAQTSKYEMTARTCMEKNSDTKFIRAHTRLQCFDKRPDPDALVTCSLAGYAKWYWAGGEGTPTFNATSYHTLHIYSSWECPGNIWGVEHTYRAKGYSLHAIFPDGTPTDYHTHLSFPVTMACGVAG